VSRALLLCALSSLAFASSLRAQLVPLSQCGSAMPCSLPTGLRPADAAALSPYGRVGPGNGAIAVSAGIEEGLKPRVVTRAVAEDPTERAARLFVKRNPSLSVRTPTPTPSRRAIKP
jgi:hypothetical protein